MKQVFIISFWLYSTLSFGQKIDSNNFFSIMEGRWTVEYYNESWIPTRDTLHQPNPAIITIEKGGMIKTQKVYQEKNYEVKEKWISYDDQSKKIFYRYFNSSDNSWGPILERYRVLFLSKDEMAFEFIGYSELAPSKPIKTRLKLRRLK